MPIPRHRAPVWKQLFAQRDRAPEEDWTKPIPSRLPPERQQVRQERHLSLLHLRFQNSLSPLCRRDLSRGLLLAPPKLNQPMKEPVPSLPLSQPRLRQSSAASSSASSSSSRFASP